jgi:hypothetical protein
LLPGGIRDRRNGRNYAKLETENKKEGKFKSQTDKRCEQKMFFINDYYLGSANLGKFTNVNVNFDARKTF